MMRSDDMRLCNECQTPLEGMNLACQACGHGPEIIGGYEALAPELAHQGGGYDADLFTELAPLEEGNFWFRARNKLITWALRRYRPQLTSFLEIGCGTGYVLSGVAAQHPGATLLGSEIFVDGLPFAASRVPTAKLMQMDAREIPFRGEIEVIGAFDVLEHITEDELVLSEIHAALQTDGLLVATVPQHPRMWSPADDHAFHVRRYTAKELRAKLEAAGFEVVRSTSFVSLLLPMMLASRLAMRGKSDDYDPIDEMRIHPWLNSLLYGIMHVEVALISCGLTFPLGGSRLIVARKIAAS